MMRGFGYGYGNMMGGWGWAGAIAMFVFGLLVLVGIVLLVIWAVRASSGGHLQGAGPQQTGMQAPGPAGHDEAVAIAKRRLASGEITPEQYAEIMRTLGG